MFKKNGWALARETVLKGVVDSWNFAKKNSKIRTTESFLLLQPTPTKASEAKKSEMPVTVSKTAKDCAELLSDRSGIIVLIFCVFFDGFGLHRFYVGKKVGGILFGVVFIGLFLNNILNYMFN